MGSVFQKSPNNWAFRYELPGTTQAKRKQKYLSGFPTKKEAEKVLAQINAKLARGEYSTTSNITVAELLDIWLSDHVATELAPKSQVFYDNYVRLYLKPNLGHYKLTELKPNHITSFYSDLFKDGKSADLVNKCHRTLRAALYQAYRWEYTDKKIIDRVKAPAVSRPAPTFWDEYEITEGIKYFSGHSIEFHVIVALNLGLRQGEICGLKEEDINYKNKTIQIRRVVQLINGTVITKPPKTKKSMRLLPLSDSMIKVFKERSKWIRENRLFFGAAYNKDWLGFFSVDNNGDIIHDRYVCNRFRGMMKRCSLPKVTFHDLRHSCASWLLHKGATIKDIQEILGHTNMSTTSDIYSHVVMDTKRELMNKLM